MTFTLLLTQAPQSCNITTTRIGGIIMKKFRIISALICMSLLLGITSPLVYAASPEAEALSNVIIEDSYAMYIMEDSTLKYTLYLDTETAIGSFAVVYKSNPDYLYDYLFTLAAEEIDTSSSVFWNNLISECFVQSSQWVTIYIPTAITQQNDYSRAAPENYFNEWLYDKYGSTHTASVMGYYIRQSQLFVIKEDLNYHVGISATYVVGYTLTVAGFITTFLGKTVAPPIVSIIGKIATVGGLILAGTQIREYVLSISYIRRAYVQGGSIVHASATKAIHYTGYANPDTGYADVDESSMVFSCYPTNELFENVDALVDAAWDHFRNP